MTISWPVGLQRLGEIGGQQFRLDVRIETERYPDIERYDLARRCRASRNCGSEFWISEVKSYVCREPCDIELTGIGVQAGWQIERYDRDRDLEN